MDFFDVFVFISACLCVVVLSMSQGQLPREVTSGLGGVYPRLTSGLVQRGKSLRAELLGISVVILKACAFRE
jgi:hypothetical protein